jgi:alpha-galactosidase
VGDIDDLCQRLVRMQDFISHPEPEHEKELPIIFNEWCSTWGNPTHDYIIRTADRLRETHTRYLVIDDGWAERPADESFQFNGDWNLNRKAFPHGIDKTTAAIRKRGLIPGIWFEFEACTEGTEAYSLTDHQLHLHGKVLQVGRRHFWDFRDPWTWEYLEEKVIRFLRENDFGYLKVDYNETIGIGCDGAESPGEGLRQHLIKVKEFFARIREQVPGIVIENCASGGHRGEPGMVALTSMSVFSDAHESVEIPIIAANQHRLTPARKNQVWAVLRPHDSIQRLYYSFAATFLGRMCISGDVMELPEATFSIVRRAQDFYVEAVPIIRDGLTRIIDRTGPSRRYPEGWQAVLRRHGGRILVVFHTFEFGEAGGGCPSVSIPLPADGHWEVSSYFGQFKMSGISGGKLIFADVEPFSGQALILARSH